MSPAKALLAAASTLGVPAAASAAHAGMAPVLLTQADPMRAFDIDKDGTLDLAEVKSAAAASFDELNPDDDSLDEREAAPVLQDQAFRQADTNGGRISKAEYLAYVERMFLPANPDNGGTLDQAELACPAGQTLLRLLRQGRA